MKLINIVYVSLSLLMLTATVNAANSATIIEGSLVQGNVKSTMSGNAYADETNALDDWCLDTGGWGGNKVAVSPTNSNFNGSSWGGTPDTMVAFGNGGSVTLKLDNAIYDVAGKKELGLFTAQMLNAGNGGYINGHMEAAVLLSTDGTNWVTLNGNSVTQNYISTSSMLNTPTVGYNYETLATAWSYGSPGTSSANLDELAIADYLNPMVDDNLFNGTGSNADRLAMKTDTSEASYDAIFGTSGGGNWFDIGNTGLEAIKYVQLNGVNCSDGYGVRLDAVYTTDASVPEPATIALLALGGIAIRRKNKHKA